MTTMTDSRAAEVLAVMRADGGTVDEADYVAAIDHAIARLREPAEAQVPSYDALLIIAQSVCGALERAGITDCDDPGEAIDVLRERYEAQAQGGGEARAWMRRWAFDGVDVMALPKKERPRGWQLWAITEGKCLDDDVPLYTAPPSAPVGVEEMQRRLDREESDHGRRHRPGAREGGGGMTGLRGFGVTFDLTTGAMRNWYSGADGVQRWADTDQPVDPTPTEGADRE